MSRVGIPRALLYYQYYPMWRAFLEELGAEVITSSPTTREELTAGCSRMVPETCLPVKVFCGHVSSLVGKCDYLFIPSIRSLEPRVYNCSKFLGLPDMIRAVVPEAPAIIDADIDVNRGTRSLYQAIYSLARPFTLNPLKVRRAVKKAIEAHRYYQELMWRRGLTPPQAIARFDSGESPAPPGDNHYRTTIALIGHPYLLYDEYINYRLLSRLEKLGVKVVTPEMVPEAEQVEAIARIEGRSYWTFEGEVIGAAGYYLEHGVDGIIGVTAFGCGPDSLMLDTVKRYACSLGKPVLHLSLDEHSGEAGIVTRLEAFVDMILRKKRCG